MLIESEFRFWARASLARARGFVAHGAGCAVRVRERAAAERALLVDRSSFLQSGAGDDPSPISGSARRARGAYRANRANRVNRAKASYAAPHTPRGACRWHLISDAPTVDGIIESFSLLKAMHWDDNPTLTSQVLGRCAS